MRMIEIVTADTDLHEGKTIYLNVNHIVSIHEGWIGHKNQGNWGTKILVAGWNRPIDTTESMYELAARINGGE